MNLHRFLTKNGKIKSKFRRSNSAAILAARPNLINGGIQFFNLDKNKEALDFFATYVDIAINPMFENGESASNRYCIAPNCLLCKLSCSQKWKIIQAC